MIVGSALLLATLPGSAVPAVPVVDWQPRCTIKGTEGADVLVGTGGRDVICGRGGDDTLLGRGGDDQLRGGRGDDELRGGPGNDLLRGESGRDAVTGGTGHDFLRGGRNADVMDARDRVGFHDAVRCGPGRGDEAFADPEDDVVAGCEEINRNDPPSAVVLTPAVVLEGAAAGTVVGRLTAVDPDLNDRHTFALVDGPGSDDNGSFRVEGAWLRTAAVFDYESEKTLSVRVRATDAAGESLAQALSVDVADVLEGAAPVAVDDAVTVAEDSAPETIEVLHNDKAAGGVPMSLGGHDPASAHGSLSDSPGRTAVVYQPKADYCGPDSFSYWLLPGGAKATVTVTVTCVDDPPVAQPDVVTVPLGGTESPIRVLDNDVDPDGGPITVVAVTRPPDGAAAIAPDGSGVVYKPTVGFCNISAPSPDTFTYTLNGGSTATVQVRVLCDGKIPVATGDRVDIEEDSGATTIDVLANDLPRTVAKTIGSVTDPPGGSVQVVEQGAKVRYVPDQDFCGTDSFDYTLTPGGLTAKVTVAVSCVEDPPVAEDDTRSTAENAPLELPVSGPGSLATNDHDADGDELTVTAASDAVGGTVELAGGLVRFTPTKDVCGAGEGRFDYTVGDGQGGLDEGRVTVDVTCASTAPDLVLDDVTLASTSFGTRLEASSDSPGAITYGIVDGDTELVAEVGPSGDLLVKGPGVVTVQASQEADGTYAARQVTATVTILDGRPGVVITSAPTQPLAPGDTFELHYRVNFPLTSQANLAGVILTQGVGLWTGDDNIEPVSHTLPPRVGEDGVIVFHVKPTAESRQSMFTLLSVTPETFSTPIDGEAFSNPTCSASSRSGLRTRTSCRAATSGRRSP